MILTCFSNAIVCSGVKKYFVVMKIFLYSALQMDIVNIVTFFMPLTLKCSRNTYIKRPSSIYYFISKYSEFHENIF